MEQLKPTARQAGSWNRGVRNPDYGPDPAFAEYAPLAEVMDPNPLAREAANCDTLPNNNGDAVRIARRERRRHSQSSSQTDNQPSSNPS